MLGFDYIRHTLLFWFIHLDVSCFARISNSLSHTYILYSWCKLLKTTEYLQVRFVLLSTFPALFKCLIFFMLIIKWV